MLWNKNRRRVVAENSGEIVTKQAPKAECDINNIIKNYQKTGVWPPASREGFYIDLPTQLDFQAAINLVRDANDAFADMPARVRDYFDNDPANLLRALKDPNARGVLEDLGVVNRTAPPPASGPGSVPVPGTGPMPGPQGAPPQAPGTSPTAPPDGAAQRPS